jgi:hypothetical protein
MTAKNLFEYTKDEWEAALAEAEKTDTKPFMEGAHFITIKDGKIEFKVAGTPRLKRGLAFDDEQAAAEHIARTMMDTNILIMSHSSSCDFPDEDGRPDFDYDEFKDRINAILIEKGF